MAIPFHNFVATQALGIAAFNACINAAYTGWLWRGLDPLTLFGRNPVGFDLASTPVWIAALSVLLGTASVRQKLQDGRVATPTARAPLIFDDLPRNILLRAILLGAISAVALALPIRLLLQASGVDVVSLDVAVALKVVLTVPLSLLIVPLIILAGLNDVQRSRRFPSQP